MRMAGYRRLSVRLCDFPGDDCPYLMKASYSFVIFQGGGGGVGSGPQPPSPTPGFAHAIYAK